MGFKQAHRKTSPKAEAYQTKIREGQAWSCTHLISALWRQRPGELYEFKDILVYIASSRLAHGYIVTPCLEKKTRVFEERVLVGLQRRLSGKAGEVSMSPSRAK